MNSVIRLKCEKIRKQEGGAVIKASLLIPDKIRQNKHDYNQKLVILQAGSPLKEVSTKYDSLRQS